MEDENFIKNIAVVGAGGNIGSFITASLLETGRHKVTALSRITSSNKFPPDVLVKRVDYDDRSTLVEALRGQDALVITLAGSSSIEETEAKRVHAAAEADVEWILPNEWSPDTANEGLVKDINFLLQPKVNTRHLIENLGKSSYTAVVTGFWYEYSLAKAGNYGFDFAKRHVIFFDDGDAAISTSTWPHVGRAVAALLSLPVHANETSKGPCLEDYRNKVVYTNSFTVSQRDMLASACRVTGTAENDWRFDSVDSKREVEEGQRMVREGNYAGLRKILYTRVFYPGDGDFECRKGTINEVLGLPEENLDEATRVAIDRQLSGGGN